jgi:hypothetical protein
VIPKPCNAYYYGGLPVKGDRRKGRLSIVEDMLCFEIPEGKGGEKVDLKIHFSNMERIYQTRDNYYGSDTVLFNLAFHDSSERPFTLRFAPVTLIPRRRIALQKIWFDYLAAAINAEGKASDLSTR